MGGLGGGKNLTFFGKVKPDNLSIRKMIWRSAPWDDRYDWEAEMHLLLDVQRYTTVASGRKSQPNGKRHCKNCSMIRGHLSVIKHTYSIWAFKPEDKVQLQLYCDMPESICSESNIDWTYSRNATLLNTQTIKAVTDHNYLLQKTFIYYLFAFKMPLGRSIMPSVV